ncbi:amidase [Jatrophihabitans sp. DSM 45814]
MSDDLHWATAEQLQGLIARREISPIEVVQDCLDRIETLEPTLHSLITVAADRALEEAAEAETAVLSGAALGPLHGVPVTVKDEVWTEGIASSGGSLVFARFTPDRDGTVAERLRRAGAIIVGKTSLPEFASWPRSKNRLGPESVNPWDPTRISGASSGGSAACVAAGLVPLSVGSDGGGSIRIPSSLCGATGLYPTPGRVPSYGSFSYSLAGSLGPIARNVRDAALLQHVIAGPDRRDAAALTDAPPDVFERLELGVIGTRIAFSPDFGRISVAAPIRQVVGQAVDQLAELGAIVELLDRPIEHPWGEPDGLLALQAEVAARSWDLNDNPEQAPDLSGAQDWMWSVFAETVPFTQRAEFLELCSANRGLLAPHSQLSIGREQPIPDAAEIQRQDDLRRSVLALFDRYDVICSPTMAVLAPLAPPNWGSPYADPYMGTNFTFIANHIGAPAASIPCGFVDGLPVGLQVIGRPGDEAGVLRVIRAYEQARPLTTEELRPTPMSPR